MKKIIIACLLIVGSILGLFGGIYAKNIDDVGCVALRTTHGKHLAEFKRMIEAKVGYEKIDVLFSA